jgi:Tol biopolymer transport system component
MPNDKVLACSVDNDAHPSKEGIYTLGLADLSLTQLTKAPFPSYEGPEGSCGGGDFAPSVSPTGSIAFLRAQCGTLANPSTDQQATLMVIDPGGEPRAIVGNRVPNSHGFSRVTWSPDGELILFGSEDGVLYTVRADGSELSSVDVGVTCSGFLYTPSWSPDGDFIIFTLARPSGSELYVARSDGSDCTRLTRQQGAEGWVSWTR